LQGFIDPVGEEDIVEHRQVLEQLELLEDHANPADSEVAPSAVVEVGDFDIVGQNLSLLRQTDPGHQMEEGRLP
jgi:hypothetical protein